MENKILIDKAIGFIQKNPKENLSLQSIADNAGFSLNYFDAIFRSHTGYSPVEYSRIYKLTRSAIDLRRTEKTVLDIALDYGYQSPESYSRAFKSFYSLTPTEYREKYSKVALTWHDISGRISIGNFKTNFPELKMSDVDSALDFCFTYNPTKYVEDIINITVAETAILTLGDPDNLEHFIYVSDYDRVEPSVDLVCENEENAILYAKLLSRLEKIGFGIHRSLDSVWDKFDEVTAKLGFTFRCGFDMLYPGTVVTVPEYEGMYVRELTMEDMPLVRDFKQRGGCAQCHVGALELALSKKGNEGTKGVGLFKNGELTCLALPCLDKIRELRKYDIGGIFTIGNDEKAVELIWKFVTDMALKDGALFGSANARKDDTVLSIAACESVGLIKVAKYCGYSKK